MITLKPMSSFDPTVACTVHDALNDKLIIWDPAWAQHYVEYATEHTEGVIAWDGSLLDGWSPLAPVAT